MRLKTKFFLLTFPIIFIFPLLISFFVSFNVFENIKEEFYRRAESISNNLERSSIYGLIAVKKEILRDTALTFLSEKDVLYVVIYGADGKLLFQSNNDLKPADRYVSSALLKNKNSSVLYLKDENGVDIYDFQHKVFAKQFRAFDEVMNNEDDFIASAASADKAIGYIRIGFSLVTINNTRNRIILIASLSWIFCIIVGLILYILLKKFILTPITTITSVMKEVAEGNDKKRVFLKSKDEVAFLGNTFNQMIDDITKSKEEIKNHSKNLEKTVEVRTFELEQAISRLTSEQEHQKAYNRIITKISSVIDLKTLLNECLNEIILATNSQAGIISLYDNVKEVFIPEIFYGQRVQDFGEYFFRIGEGIPGKSVEKGEKVILSNVPMIGNFRVNCSFFSSLPETYVCYPVLFSGKPLATMEIISLYALNENYIQFLDNIVSQMGVAINNALINKETKEIAAKLQESTKELERQNSELQDKQKELNLKNKQLEEANKHKSEFVANMSHELRTPLNSILGFSTTILKGMSGSVSDQAKQDVQNIYNSGKHLLGLINDILDLSKIEAGKIDVFKEYFDINEVISQVRDTVQVLLKNKNIHFEVKVEENLPSILNDKTKLKQVILNLVSNSVKFTDSGKIKIAANKAEDKIIFSVTDTGIGIKKEDYNKIFEEFRQIDNSTTRKVGGTGLGLAISKKFIELMGGAIWFESEYNIGSVFYVSIPINNEVVQTSPQVAGNRNVLIVENDPASIDILRRFLERSNFSVTIAVDGDECLTKLKTKKPDIIILDIILPKKTGWEIIKEIKKDPDLRNIPVVISSIIEKDKIANQMGIKYYLSKPISEENLLEILKTIESEFSEEEIKLASV